jgi:hypothetical protein
LDEQTQILACGLDGSFAASTIARQSKLREHGASRKSAKSLVLKERRKFGGIVTGWGDRSGLAHDEGRKTNPSAVRVGQIGGQPASGKSEPDARPGDCRAADGLKGNGPNFGDSIPKQQSEFEAVSETVIFPQGYRSISNESLRNSPTRNIPMSKQEQNKAVGSRWFTEFWGKSVNLAVVDEIAAPDMLLKYSLHEPRRGRGDIKAFMTDFRAAFPDLNFWGHRGSDC